MGRGKQIAAAAERLLDNADVKARPMLEQANARLGFVLKMYEGMAKALAETLADHAWKG